MTPPSELPKITIATPRWLGPPEPEKDRSRAWLRGALAGLLLLAGTAAAVSVFAQFVFVAHARHAPIIAGLEAAIPDVSAFVFACLGIALALKGKRAVRARLLNAGAVATSVFMNYAAAGHGWRDTAIWIMPPIAYALASDCAIGYIRASVMHESDGRTLLDYAARGLLYVLRFVVAAPSTIRGARLALLNATPLPDPAPAAAVTPLERAPARAVSARAPAARKRNGPTKGQVLVGLAADAHDLTVIDPARVSAIATGLAAAADLHPATARRVLRRHVLSLQGAPS